MITPRATFIKELVDPEHQLFHHRIQSCSYNLDRHHLSRVLIDNMIHHEGIGISANQIGIWERAFAMVRDLENNEIIVCFNPRIIKSYSEEVEMEEGCLSYPELFLKIKRPDKIIVKYEDENKKTHKMKLQGLASRVFQHEYDHMEGIDFTQRT
jgi:peptide deformylase|tara:strand:- start:24 stop:485 length:462 start_codon:yes stop_codon:yes gene_type:complete